MATRLDFEEQEQIDRIRGFWSAYGNLVTWTLVLVLGAFAALADDRRGDILAAQGKAADATAAYRKAWQAMDAKVEYRSLVEAKLTALGASPAAAASGAASGAAT